MGNLCQHWDNAEVLYIRTGATESYQHISDVLIADGLITFYYKMSEDSKDCLICVPASEVRIEFWDNEDEPNDTDPDNQDVHTACD